MRGTPASRTHVEVVKDVSNLASKTHMVVVGALSNAWSFLGQGRYSDFTSTVFGPLAKTCKTTRNKSSKSCYARHLPREVALLLLLAGPQTALQCLLCPNTIYAFSGSFEPVELCTQTSTSTYLYLVHLHTMIYHVSCFHLLLLHAFPIVSRLRILCLSGSNLKLSTALL